MKKIETRKLTLSRESLRFLDGTGSKLQFAGMPETVVGHSCDSCAY